MLEWTGERFVPWMKDAGIAYEHLHRYAYAAGFVKEKRVLDLASGEGYGSKILAGSALSVLGVDIDEESVHHANTKYGSSTLQFISGSITAIPINEDHSFDVIVCFEAIEHIDEHVKLLCEVKRLLTREGLFIVSTPNKIAYNQDNPFHRKELQLDEFQELLRRHFQQVRFLGQRVHPNSSIWPLEAENTSHVDEFVMERDGTEFRFMSNSKRVPLYVIALASDSAEPQTELGSVMVDYSNELLNEKDEAIRELRESKVSQQEAIVWQETQLQEQKKAVAWLEGQVALHEGSIHDLQQGIAWLETQLNDSKNSLERRAHEIDELQRAKGALEARAQKTLLDLHNTNRQLALTTKQLEDIYASRSWKIVLRLRHIRDSLFPLGSLRRRLWNKAMALVKFRG